MRFPVPLPYHIFIHFLYPYHITFSCISCTPIIPHFHAFPVPLLYHIFMHFLYPYHITCSYTFVPLPCHIPTDFLYIWHAMIICDELQMKNTTQIQITIHNLENAWRMSNISTDYRQLYNMQISIMPLFSGSILWKAMPVMCHHLAWRGTKAHQKSFVEWPDGELLEYGSCHQAVWVVG